MLISVSFSSAVFGVKKRKDGTDGISELFPSEVAITLTFPQETTIGDMNLIIQELANNLNRIFSFDMGTKRR